MNIKRSIFFIIATLILGSNAANACSNTITVTNNNDSGEGSLRQSLLDVCDSGSIGFARNYTIYLQSVLTIEKNLSIDGGDNNITFSGDSDQDGSANNVSILDNSSGKNVTLTKLTLTDANGATFGAITTNGSMTIEQVLFEGNSSDSLGSAITNTKNLTVTNSVFANNHSSVLKGSAVYSYAAENFSIPINTLNNNTFYGNVNITSQSGGSIYQATNQAVFHLSNNLIDSSTNNACQATLSTNVNNWIEDGSCSATYSGDPKLLDPANGDYSLARDSGAVDIGIDTGLDSDFIGRYRPFGDAIDLGAFELLKDISTKQILLDAGGSTSCVIFDNQMQCWGSTSKIPNVSRLTNPTKIAISSFVNAACALDDSGAICGGFSSDLTVAPDLTHPTQISMPFFHACALDDNGVSCWGADSEFESITVPTLISPQQVTVGNWFSCALDEVSVGQMEVNCWGVRDGVVNNIPVLSNPSKIGSGVTHMCALDDTGVKCWGDSTYGETDIPALTNPSQLFVGYFNTCVIDDTGLVCWGNDQYGQVSDIPTLDKVEKIALGTYHICALDSDQGVVCWGSNGSKEATVPSLNYHPSSVNLFSLNYRPTENELFSYSLADRLSDFSSTPVSYSIVSGNDDAAFTIDSSGVISGTTDYENDNGQYVIEILVTNDDGSTITVSVTLDATNVGEAPYFSSVELSIDENSTKNTEIGTIDARADEANSTDALTFSIESGNEDGIFELDASSGLLKVAKNNAVDYELQSSYALAIKVVDDESRATTETITINVNDIDTPNELLNGALSGSSSLDLIQQFTGESADSYLSWNVASAGDFNNDGLDDVIFGAPFDSSIGKKAGKVYVVFGKASGALSTLAEVSNGVGGFALYGENAGDMAGYAVTGGGDVNGDGIDDIVIGAPYASDITNNFAHSGRAYVIFGTETPATMLFLSNIADDANSAGFMMYSDTYYDYSGGSVSLGDVNGDGKADVIIGEPLKHRDPLIENYRSPIYSDAKGTYYQNIYGDPIIFSDYAELAQNDDYEGLFAFNPAYVYVVFGKSDGAAVNLLETKDDADTRGFAIYEEDNLVWKGSTWLTSGFSISDQNGDGLVDIALINNTLTHGDIIFGRNTKTSINLDTAVQGDDYSYWSSGEANNIGYISDQGHRAGLAFINDSVGDINADGIDDFLVIAPDKNRFPDWEHPRAYLFFGTADKSDRVATDLVNGVGGFMIENDYSDSGFDINEIAYASAAGLGDINGDGYDDFILGDPEINSVFVIYGKSDTDIIQLSDVVNNQGGYLLEGAKGDTLGNFSAKAGDVNGDGISDFILSSTEADSLDGTLNYTGRAYLLFGEGQELTQSSTTESDIMGGSTGADRFSSGLADDVLVGGGGADVLYGGSGDDSITISDTDFIRIDGGSGFDTLVFDGADLDLDLTSAPERVRGIEIFNITGSGDNQLSLVKTSGSLGRVIVIGDAGDKLLALDQLWIQDGAESYLGSQFKRFTDGTAIMLVHPDVWVGINTAPEVSDASFSLAEGSPNDAVVGTIEASDVDYGDTISYRLLGNVGSIFAIDQAGEVTVANDRGIDFEAVPGGVFNIIVEVVDSFGEAAQATLTVSIIDASGSSHDQNYDFSAEDVSIWHGTGVGSALELFSSQFPDVDTDIDFEHNLDDSLPSNEDYQQYIDAYFKADTFVHGEVSMDGGLVDLTLPMNITVDHEDEVPLGGSVSLSIDASYLYGAGFEASSPNFVAKSSVTISDVASSLSVMEIQKYEFDLTGVSVTPHQKEFVIQQGTTDPVVLDGFKMTGGILQDDVATISQLVSPSKFAGISSSKSTWKIDAYNQSVMAGYVIAEVTGELDFNLDQSFEFEVTSISGVLTLENGDVINMDMPLSGLADFDLPADADANGDGFVSATLAVTPTQTFTNTLGLGYNLGFTTKMGHLSFYFYPQPQGNPKLNQKLVTENEDLINVETTYMDPVQFSFDLPSYNIELTFDVADTDTDADGYVDHLDAFPNDITEWVDSDGDGTGDNNDADPYASSDFDLDGIVDSIDTDDDNDGIDDDADAFPLDATETADTDLDGLGDNTDEVDNRLSYVLYRSYSVTPDLSTGYSVGFDISREVGSDDFFFSYSGQVYIPQDETYTFTVNSTEIKRLSINNTLVIDDSAGENTEATGEVTLTEGWHDIQLEYYEVSGSESLSVSYESAQLAKQAIPASSFKLGVDTDGDFITDAYDSDDDNDGVEDALDDAPLDADVYDLTIPMLTLTAGAVTIDLNESYSEPGYSAIDNFDGDISSNVVVTGTVDNTAVGVYLLAYNVNDNAGNSAILLTREVTVLNYALVDSDGDGIPDVDDAFPEDAAESVDTDGDGVGNNADTDDDNDDVADVDDAFPDDATESVDTDADGVGNNADTDDDNDNVADVDDAFPNDAAEDTDTDNDGIGNNADTDDDNDGITDELDGDPLDDKIGDITQPEFSSLSLITLNAAGLLTNITDYITVVAIDAVDGDIDAEIEGDNQLLSGHHVVQLSATDGAGNQALTTVEVNINPELSIEAELAVEASGTYPITLRLSGDAAVYPVSFDYNIIFNDVVIETATKTIDSGSTAQVMVNVDSDVLITDSLAVTLTDATNAYIAQTDKSILIITEENVAPSVQVSMVQEGQMTSIVDADKGLVTFTAIVTDINRLDEHDILWTVDSSMSSASFSDSGLDDDAFTFEFSPENVSEGYYTLQVQVSENNTEEGHSSTLDLTVIVENLVELSGDNDSDNDGISDSEEGHADSDNDGIVNYLDNDDNPTRLPSSDNNQPLQTSAGLTMRLGNLTRMAQGAMSDDASLTLTELAESVGDDAAYTNDERFELFTPLYNFIISGLAQAGDSAVVVIPLAEDKTLPEGAVFRKYNSIYGWFNFVEDANNSIGSASAGENGNCPAANDASYTQGLTQGDNCFQLIIEDGGPNDADFTANGEVEDPGAIVIEKTGTIEPEPENEVPSISIDAHDVSFIESTTISLISQGSDSNGDDLTYQWQQISGTAISFDDATTAQVSIVLPAVTADELIELQVTISDGELTSVEITSFTITNVAEVITVTPPKKSGGSMAWLLVIILLVTAKRTYPLLLAKAA